MFFFSNDPRQFFGSTRTHIKKHTQKWKKKFKYSCKQKSTQTHPLQIKIYLFLFQGIKINMYTLYCAVIVLILSQCLFIVLRLLISWVCVCVFARYLQRQLFHHMHTLSLFLEDSMARNIVFNCDLKNKNKKNNSQRKLIVNMHMPSVIHYYKSFRTCNDQKNAQVSWFCLVYDKKHNTV